MKQAILIVSVLVVVSAAVYISYDDTAASHGRDYLADVVQIYFPGSFAQSEGREAFISGVPIDDHPGYLNDNAAHEWRLGWTQAHWESRQSR